MDVQEFLQNISDGLKKPITKGDVFGQEIAKPSWNDNPLNFKKPLSFYHFGAIFLLVIGLSIIIGTAIKYQQLNLFGLSSIAFGIGILLGINLLLKFTKN